MQICGNDVTQGAYRLSPGRLNISGGIAVTRYSLQTTYGVCHGALFSSSHFLISCFYLPFPSSSVSLLILYYLQAFYEGYVMCPFIISEDGYCWV